MREMIFLFNILPRLLFGDPISRLVQFYWTFAEELKEVFWTMEDDLF